MVTVNFYGCEKYEIIIYLARLMQQLGDRILIADFSDNAALSKGINRQMQISAVNEPVDYYGVFFTDLTGTDDKVASDILNHIIEEYKIDYLFIDMGYDMREYLAQPDNIAVYVTDQQIQNINDFSICYKKTHMLYNESHYLLLKDIFSCRIDITGLIRETTEHIEKEKLFVLPHDDYDTVLRLMAIYDADIYPGRLSEAYEIMLSHFIKKFHPDIDRKSLRRLFSMRHKRIKSW